MSEVEIILAIVMIAEILFTIQVYCNFHYAIKKYRRKRLFRTSCVLIVPCKGLDETFETNICSFYQQAYEGYKLWFVVEDKADIAYEVLLRLKDSYALTSSALDVRILVAGKTAGCSQKLHNLLYAYTQTDSDVKVLVFADSDACAGPDWLAQLVAPLRKSSIGLSSGYRWFVPKTNNLATLALSAMNAKVCQLLGNTRYNLAWGGSMAIRRADFERLDIPRLWARSLSDDLSLSRAVRKAKMRTRFVPACMIASYTSTTWSKLWEFARRQFIITRVYAPRLWLFGLLGALFSVAGLWGGLALMVYAIVVRPAFWLEYAAVGIVFLTCQILRAVIRQEMAFYLLEKDRDALRLARWADWLGFWAWDCLMLAVIAASAFGNTITWRNIRYRIHGTTDIEIINDKSDKK